MDPQTFNHAFHTVKTSGHRYHYIDEKPASYDPKKHPTILCCHGFPDLWWGYRYQIRPFVEQGWRVIVPDQLGYGGTDKPKELEKYGYKSIARDLKELLEDGAGLAKEDKILIVCHDWGAIIGQRFWLYYPDKVQGIVSICVPFTPASSAVKGDFVPLETMVKTSVPTFGYQLFFASKAGTELLDKAPATFLAPSFGFASHSNQPQEKSGRWAYEGEMEKNTRKQLAMGREEMILKSGVLDKDPELRYYYENFKKGGFEYPLNYYRNREINWDDEKSTSHNSDLPVSFPPIAPALFISPTHDGALPLGLSKAKSMWRAFPSKNLWWTKLSDGSDHWALQDPRFRDELTDILIKWNKGVLQGKWRSKTNFSEDKDGRRVAKL
ncbi:alpha/beta-hydrolase [Atractiella rhizophila]|nr:alpha/beta-hydrolase [Atractiella rhizophila]